MLNSFNPKVHKSRVSDQECIYLEDTPRYRGLQCYSRSSRFLSLYNDPIYKFPTLNNFPLPTKVYTQDCQVPASINSTDFYQSLQEKSPFNRGKSQEFSRLAVQDRGVPKNSMNSNNSQSFLSVDAPFNLAEELEMNRISLSSSYISSAPDQSSLEKADISLNTKEMILKIHSNFTAQQENELFLNSITPASSINLSEYQDSEIYHHEIVFNSSNAEISEIENDLEPNRLYNSINIVEECNRTQELPVICTKQTDESFRKRSCLVELLAESSGDCSRGQSHMTVPLDSVSPQIKPTEEDEISSPEDEGPLGISAGRLFLNGETASKAKLVSPAFTVRVIRELPSKPPSDSSSQLLSTVPETQPSVEIPDMHSPLVQKLLIIECSGRTGTIHSALACTGFSSVFQLEYSSSECENRAFPAPPAPNSLRQGLLSLDILRLLMKFQIEWVSCGFENMAIVTTEGKVMTWGYGGSGCLGHGDTDSYKVPTLVTSILHQRIVYLECGAYHTAAVNEEGEVWVWGRGDVNQLGISLQELTADSIGHVALRPMKIKELAKRGVVVKSVACGEAHTLLLEAEGRVYAFGWAEDGQLGLAEDILKDGIMSKSPRCVHAISNKIIKISAGSIFSACLSDNGQVLVWGNGEEGQLGIGNSITSAEFPVVVGRLKHEFIVDIVCGGNYMLCVAQSGKVYGWGRGVTGRFYGTHTYPTGSDIICFIPRVIPNIDIAQRYLVVNQCEGKNFAKLLTEKLMKLKDN